MKTQYQVVLDGYDIVPRMPAWKTIMILVFSATGGAVWFGLTLLAICNLLSKIAGY